MGSRRDGSTIAAAHSPDSKPTGTAPESALPEFRDISTNDWFSLKDRFSGFTIRRDEADTRGYEEYYCVGPGFYLRIYECVERLGFVDRVVVPHGLLHLGFFLRGDTELTVSGYGKVALTSPAMYIIYVPPNCAFDDAPVRHDQDRLFVDLIINPEEFSPDAIGLDATLMPNWLERAMSGQDTFAVERFHMGPGLLLAVNALVSNSPGPALKRVYAQAKAMEILCHALELISQEEARHDRSSLSAEECRRMNQMRLCLDENYAPPPTLEELSKQFSMSGSKLKRAFKAVFGIPIGEYSQALRMRKANEMLRDGGRNVNQVAALLGYEHTSSFITAFKRFFGTTPKAWQKLVSRGP